MSMANTAIGKSYRYGNDRDLAEHQSLDGWIDGSDVSLEKQHS
jgi:hypothetical protein